MMPELFCIHGDEENDICDDCLNERERVSDSLDELVEQLLKEGWFWKRQGQNTYLVHKENFLPTFMWKKVGLRKERKHIPARLVADRLPNGILEEDA